jgi:hypothetical protein
VIERIFKYDIIAKKTKPLKELLLSTIVKNGERVREREGLEDTRKYVKEQMEKLPEEIKRIINPSNYEVKISDAIRKTIQQLTGEMYNL